MSIALMTEAWKADMPSGRKLVLLSLCDNANDQGECYPSVSMVAQRCSMGERTVQGHINDLEAAGIVTRQERKGRSTIYRIDPSRFRVSTAESHYTYRIDDPATGEFYIGVRTCRGPASTDGYMGSGAWFQRRVSDGGLLRKTVLATFDDRESADRSERELIQQSIADPLCMNQRTPADSAPRKNSAPQKLRPTPADSAPPPPQKLRPTPADSAPITVNEPSIEPSKEPSKKKAPAFELPDWVDRDLWDAWHSCAKRRNATALQKQLAVKKLAQWRDEGVDWRQALESAALAGWQGLFKPEPGKAAQKPVRPALMTESQRADWDRQETEKAKRLLFGDTFTADVIDAEVLELTHEPK